MSNGPDTGSRVPQHIVGVDDGLKVLKDLAAEAVAVLTEPEREILKTHFGVTVLGDVDAVLAMPDTPSEAGATFGADESGTRPANLTEWSKVEEFDLSDFEDDDLTAPAALDDKVIAEREERSRHIRRERGKQEIQARVKLPEMSEAWRESDALRTVLAESSMLMEYWFRLPTHVLGELSQEPGLHHTIMSAQTHIVEARRMLTARAGKTQEWLEAFKTIAALSLELEAWEYSEMAAAALMDGPHTEAWEGAIEWFRAAWSTSRRRLSDMMTGTGAGQLPPAKMSEDQFEVLKAMAAEGVMGASEMVAVEQSYRDMLDSRPSPTSPPSLESMKASLGTMLTAVGTLEKLEGK